MEIIAYKRDKTGDYELVIKSGKKCYRASITNVHGLLDIFSNSSDCDKVKVLDHDICVRTYCKILNDTTEIINKM